MKTVEILQGKPEDIVKILRLMKKSHESWMKDFPDYDEGCAMVWIAEVLSRGLVLNAELGGRLVGTIGFTPAKLPWNKLTLHLRSEWFTLADPAVEGLREQLLRKAWDIAKARGMSLLLNIPAQHDTALTQACDNRMFSSYWVGDK